MEHRTGQAGQFKNKYKVYKFLYYEEGHDINQAIPREKVIKGGSRARKINLINALDPQWDDSFEKFSPEPNDQQVAV
jgi:putative endonuclease